MLTLACLETVLILTQDRYTVCAECTTSSKIIWTHPMEHLGDLGHLESRFYLLEIVLVSVQDRCTVCTKRTIGSEIIFDAPDSTPRCRGSSGCSHQSVWRQR
jgi:hypothetical protein